MLRCSTYFLICCDKLTKTYLSLVLSDEAYFLSEFEDYFGANEKTNLEIDSYRKEKVQKFRKGKESRKRRLLKNKYQRLYRFPDEESLLIKRRQIRVVVVNLCVKKEHIFEIGRKHVSGQPILSLCSEKSDYELL